jgi:oligopeptide transport system substrate-binding protein
MTVDSLTESGGPRLGREGRTRRLWVVVGLLGLVAAACGSSSTPGSGANAASQVLKFPTYQNPGTWDPGEADAEVDTEIMQNVFDNLWRFDNKLNIVPDIATTVPSQANGGISSDGLTYTVHLNPNATFDNGDKVTAQDVLYSWDRAAALQGAYSSNLSAIAGFADVQKAAGSPPASSSGSGGTLNFQQSVENGLWGCFHGKSSGATCNSKLEMSGLTAPDGLTGDTVQITLAHGCGWCLTAWTLEGTTGAIVDQKVIHNDPVNWWSKPAGPGATDGMVGTGAFYLASFTPKQSMVFKAVSNWWGSPKPTLKEVDIDIKDPSAIAATVSAFKQGSYGIIGYGGNSSQLDYPTIEAIKGSSYSKDLLTLAKGRTTWLSFNIGWTKTGGPFLGESAAAVGLRKAFDLAVDKKGLASTVCHDLLCKAATSGLISPGLTGNLGEGNDPLADYNPTEAKALLQQYDPTGSLTKNLTYSYNTGGLNDPTAAYLQNEWQVNLGIHVNLQPVSDASQFISNRLGGAYVMSRDGWQFDYNHPQDWYDNLWGYLATAAGANTSGFDDPTYDNILKQADQEPLTQALPLYNQLAQILIKDVAYIPLYYAVGNFLIQPWVHGAGSNAGFDYYWNQISISSH